MAPTWEVNRSRDAEVPPGELLTVATLNFRVVYGEAPSNDETESPLLVGNDDSTYGPGRIQRAPSGPSPSQAKDPETPRTCAARPDGVPVERDTQWQMGSTPPGQNPTDGEDLNSLLNGR